MSEVVSSAMLPAIASVNRLRLFVAFRAHTSHTPLRLSDSTISANSTSPPSSLHQGYGR
jgi:hypothetical protein